MVSNYNLCASVVYHKTVAKFETCQQSIKSTHNASILSSIIAVNKRSFQSFYFQLTRLFIEIKTGISPNLYVLAIGIENKEILFCL